MKNALPVLIVGISSVIAFSVYTFADAQSSTPHTVDIQAIVAGCGDLQIGIGEDCDSSNLNGRTCATQGFQSGALTCTASCSFNTTSCVAVPPSGGSGGGGSSVSTKKSVAQVVLSGRAYPRSKVTVLKDAQVVTTTIADSNAWFQVGVQNLSSGSYIFSVYSVDTKGVRSALLTFPVAITKNALTKIENIFIAPTIATDKKEVRKGDPIVIFGQSTPVSEVTVAVNSENQIFMKTPSGQSGAYLHTFDTSTLKTGLYYTNARTLQGSTVSAQSATIAFTVGSKNVFPEAVAGCSIKADFNNDCKVNLLDFSIAAFWSGRTFSASFSEREASKVNGDGKINLVDFSIMAFYWTG